LSFLAAMTGSVPGFLTAIAAFLFVLTLIVFIHELGHYLVARWCGVRVEVFSVGFGREIVGFDDRHGTRWRLSLIPLGGYVKFFGDFNEASMPDPEAERMSAADRAVALPFQPVWKRAAIVAAGPLANFLLAILIYAGTFMLVGQQIMPPKVAGVVPGGAAAQAGFQPGDFILSIDGKPVESFADVQRIVSLRAGDRLIFEVERKNQLVTLEVVPQNMEVTGLGGKQRMGRIGLQGVADINQVIVKTYGPSEAVVMAVRETGRVINDNLRFITRAFEGKADLSQLSGPIGIARVAGEVASISLISLIALAATLSVSIGLVNLFPIPILDGGHLVLLAYEGVVGRPLNAMAQEWAFRAGFVLLIGLMVFSVVNDVIR
jgi:regulator of sigma E protease